MNSFFELSPGGLGAVIIFAFLIVFVTVLRLLDMQGKKQK